MQPAHTREREDVLFPTYEKCRVIFWVVEGGALYLLDTAQCAQHLERCDSLRVGVRTTVAV